MTSIADRVLRTIRAHHLVAPGARVLAAVSGGGDSVALAYLLRELDDQRALVLAGVAHLNHLLRGAAAGEDAQLARQVAERLRVPFVFESADVRVAAASDRTSLEDAGRRARLAFFSRAAAQLEASAVAVGHTRDDQAETFLLRVLRGAGARGMASILPRAQPVIRPLLDITREELREYLRARALPYREDESNQDLAVPRNRIRHELLPYLRAHFSPGIVNVLAREAAMGGEDADFLDEAASKAAGPIVLVQEHHTDIDRAGLLSLPPAMARRVVRAALMGVAGGTGLQPRSAAAEAGRHQQGRFIGYDHVDSVMQIARAAAGAIDLPGVRVRAESSRIVIRALSSRTSRTASAETTEAADYLSPLSVPGEVQVPGGVTISSRAAAQAGVLAGRTQEGEWVTVPAASVRAPLAVRNRRPGDAYRPLGMEGRKTLQDVFVDRKLPRASRSLVPLVVDAEGRIVWVVGCGISEDFRVTDPSQPVVILEARRSGGLG